MMWDCTGTVYLVCLVFCLRSTHCAPQEVLAQNAYKDCEHGLAAYNDVLSGKANTTGLQNGHSGWISGNAKLSDVLSFAGCFEFEEHVIQEKYRNISKGKEHDCITLCKTSSYIGLRGATCFCIKGKERNNQSFKEVKCNDTCLMPTLACYNRTLLYRLAGKLIKPGGHQQCVYIYKKNNGTIHYGSASCYTVSGPSVHGYICSYGGLCKEPKRKGGCIVKKFNHAWTQAYTECKRSNGSLITSAYSGEFSHLVSEINKKYWIGEFRAIAQTSKEETGACLVVTKVNDSFLLDSYDCNTSKQPICYVPGKNDITPTFPLSTTAAPIKPETPPTERSDEKSGKVPVVIGVTFGGLALLVIIACIFLTMRRRKRNGAVVNRSTLLTHENDFTNTGTDNTLTIEEAKGMPDEDHHYEAAIVEPVKATHSKPERHTLRRQKQSIQSYENFQLIPAKDTKTETSVLGSVHANPANDQYDRIDLKHAKQRGKSNRDYVDSERNIYNHTTCDRTNEDAYDTTHPRSLATNTMEDYALVNTTKLPQVSFNDISEAQNRVHENVDKRSAMDKHNVTEIYAVDDSVYSVAKDSGQTDLRPMCEPDNQNAIYSVAQKSGRNNRNVINAPINPLDTYSVAQKSGRNNRNVINAPSNPLDTYSVAQKSGQDMRTAYEAPGTPIGIYSVAKESGYNNQCVGAEADNQNKPRGENTSETHLEALKCGVDNIHDEAESAYHYVDDDQLSHDAGLPRHTYTDDNYAVIGQPDHVTEGAPNKDQSKCPTEAVYEEVNNLK